MKKVLYLAIALALTAAALAGCRHKVVTTPGAAAKTAMEHIMNDNYDAFVDGIVFTEPVKPEARKVVNAIHAKALRTIHHPAVIARGGVKEVKVVSQKPSADNKTADVVLTNTYNNGVVETVNCQMVNDGKVWKVRVTPNKEVWRSTSSDGDHEVIKIREGKEREFIKDKDNGEKEFVKDIVRRNGQVEVIKVLHNGERHREVIRDLDEAGRHIDNLNIDRPTSAELEKAKTTVENRTERAKEVIRK